MQIVLIEFNFCSQLQQEEQLKSSKISSSVSLSRDESKKRAESCKIYRPELQKKNLSNWKCLIALFSDLIKSPPSIRSERNNKFLLDMTISSSFLLLFVPCSNSYPGAGLVVGGPLSKKIVDEEKLSMSCHYHQHTTQHSTFSYVVIMSAGNETTISNRTCTTAWLSLCADCVCDSKTFALAPRGIERATDGKVITNSERTASEKLPGELEHDRACDDKLFPANTFRPKLCPPEKFSNWTSNMTSNESFLFFCC